MRRVCGGYPVTWDTREPSISQTFDGYMFRVILNVFFCVCVLVKINFPLLVRAGATAGGHTVPYDAHTRDDPTTSFCQATLFIESPTLHRYMHDFMKRNPVPNKHTGIKRTRATLRHPPAHIHHRGRRRWRRGCSLLRPRVWSCLPNCIRRSDSRGRRRWD